jgi:hypothetical protein
MSDQDDYYNDDYEDDYYDYDNNKQKFNFKFDHNAWAEWLSEAMKDLIENPKGVWSFIVNPSFPVKSIGFSDTGDKKSHLYLGTNSYSEVVWKNKYFAKNDGHQKYIKHLQSHAVHFLQQPLYYKGLFDIMN